MNDLGFIHRYIPAKEGSSRTLLLLHGTGGNEDDLVPLAGELDGSAGILSPRGKVLERGMPRFFRRFAEGVFDEEDLKFRAGELAEFVSQAAKIYQFDAGQVIAVGYSNGANIAAGLLLLSPETLKSAILLHAMVPFEPVSAPSLTGKSVFLSASQADPIVPAENSKRLASMLANCGADVKLEWFSGGHNLSLPEVRAAAAWLNSEGIA